MIDLQSFKLPAISLLATLVIAVLFSWLSGIDYLYSALIIGGAILANGLIIAVTEKDDAD